MSIKEVKEIEEKEKELHEMLNKLSQTKKEIIENEMLKTIDSGSLIAKKLKEKYDFINLIENDDFIKLLYFG